MKRFCIAIASFILITGLAAQGSDYVKLESISLQEARELALKQNSAYAAKEAAVNAAKWGKTNALSSFMPSLSFSATYINQDPATSVQIGSQAYIMNNDMRTLAFNLSQPLFVGGKLYQAYKMAGLGAEMAALSLQSQRYLLLSEVESKYLSALQLRTVLQLSQNELQSAKDNLTIAKLKLDNGIISQPDYLRFQSNLASKEVSALQADTALQIVLRDFANYLGSVQILMPEELSIANEQVLIDRLDAYDLTKTQLLSQKAMQIALQRNLGIKTLVKSVELSERAYSLAKGSFLPTLMLTGSRQYKENGFDRYEFSPSNQIMLNLSIPILPGLGNYASMQKAKEEARKTALENKTATDGIKLGLESAILTWISSAKQINSASLALAYSEEFYAQMQERFNQNMLSAKDLLDAELMLSAAKLAHSNAFFAYLKARSVMMQSLAIDNPNDLIGLLDN